MVCQRGKQHRGRVLFDRSWVFCEIGSTVSYGLWLVGTWGTVLLSVGRYQRKREKVENNQEEMKNNQERVENNQEEIKNNQERVENNQEKTAFGCQRELESLRIEYQNQFDRSNKLDNKVYIAITFCGFLFVFITGLFSGISKISRPENGVQTVLTAGYILICIAVMVSYVYVLIFFMRLLQPEQIIRMDPEKLEKAELGQMEDAQACQTLILLYRKVINENLNKLKLRCDEFTKGLRFIVPTVLLAFGAYAFQLVLSMA